VTQDGRPSRLGEGRRRRRKLQRRRRRRRRKKVYSTTQALAPRSAPRELIHSFTEWSCW
jgi:hypothetical protein